jgi:hypothetical protein
MNTTSSYFLVNSTFFFVQSFNFIDFGTKHCYLWKKTELTILRDCLVSLSISSTDACFKLLISFGVVYNLPLSNPDVGTILLIFERVLVINMRAVGSSRNRDPEHILIFTFELHTRINNDASF